MPTTKKKDELLEQPAQTTTQQSVPAQSSTVQQAQSALQQASNSGYQSKWQPQINTMMDQYVNRDKFSYDVNEDALFQQLKEQYAMMGQQAMMDTMGQASALTGGYGNSYAQGVGQQAYQGYLQQLTDRVPDFYQMALNQYLNEGDQMQDSIAMMMQQENVDYGKYRDQMADRDKAYKKLLDLMINYHYEPTKKELADAGMTTAQKNAVMKPYYDYLAALAAEEEYSGGDGAYVPPEKPQNPYDLPPDYNSVRQDIIDAKNNGADNSAIQSMINAAEEEGYITPAQKKGLSNTYNRG